MMDEDQADGTPPTGKAIDWTLVARRDEARLKRVKDIYQRGRLMTGGNDYFNAALILQHGNTPQDYLLAHELAAVAISKKRGLDPWERSAKIASWCRSAGRSASEPSIVLRDLTNRTALRGGRGSYRSVTTIDECPNSRGSESPWSRDEQEVNAHAFPSFARCQASRVTPHRRLLLAFLFWSLASSSCAQRKQTAKAVAAGHPRVIWQYDTGGWVFSVPAVAGDLAFIGSCAGTFYALNETTGEVRWSYNIRKDGKQRSFHGNPLITDELILIGTDYSCDPDGIGHVYAFERNTGKVRWKYQTTSVPTDILRIGSNVYFGSFQDHWSALNLKTGELVWSFSTGAANPDCTMVKSPVADAARLYLTGLDGFVYSLDTATGRVIWKRKLSAPPSTALALIGSALFVGTSANHLYRLNPESGATAADLAVEATPVGRLTLTDDSLLLFLENRAERSGYILSVDSQLKNEQWQQKSTPDWASERLNVWKGLVLAGNCRGELAAFRASDGAPQWKLNLKGCIRSIGNSDDMLFVGVQEGTVYALRY